MYLEGTRRTKTDWVEDEALGWYAICNQVLKDEMGLNWTGCFLDAGIQLYKSDIKLTFNKFLGFGFENPLQSPGLGQRCKISLLFTLLFLKSRLGLP